MIIAVLILASALVAVWIVLLCMATTEDWLAAGYGKMLNNMDEIGKLKAKDAKRAAELAKCHGIEATVRRLFCGGNSEKEIRSIENKNRTLRQGNLKSVGVFEIPGYVVQRIIPAIGLGNVHKEILSKCTELYGKKYADHKAKSLLAQIISYPFIGVPMALVIGAMVAVMMDTMTGAIVMAIGTILVCVLVYALYDEVGDRLNKRRAAISSQFPNVVSKLALLVTSGMIMDKAWRETAESQEMELYQEMRKTADELSNLVEPAAAYSNFMDRCNTKETTKLASALIQNQTKGNAEIGQVLKNMAKEAWLERRHSAKRASEAANSKLMIPTMMLFLAILVMIMVPVIMNFASL